MGKRVADTSKEAFAAIEPQLSERRQQVLDAIQTLGEASNYQVSLYLRWPINRVTGRVTELRKMGHIELAGVVPGQFKVRNQVWKIAEKKPQQETPEQLTLMEMDCGDG